MSKYQKYFQQMLEENKELFDQFKRIHDKYLQDDVKYQDEFNEIGKDVVEVIRKYELMLCSKSEGGQYCKYASTLADKFWTEVRRVYPRIDFVGAQI